MGDEEPVPIKFRFKKAFETLLEGKEQVEHYHKKTISDERFRELAEKGAQKPLSDGENYLYKEYLRAKIYQQRKNEIERDNLPGKILYLASGFDGIPSHVFGQDNVIMTSAESHYYQKYFQWLKDIKKTDKIVANMFANPLKSESFSTLVINNIPIFDKGSERSDIMENPTESLLKELKRVSKPAAVLIVTNYDPAGAFPNSSLIPEEVRESMGKIGWKIEEEDYTDQQPYCRLRSVEPEAERE